MPVTNKYGLPSTLVNLADRDNYSKGRAHRSATQLIGSPRLEVLKARHASEIQADVSDMIWPLLGRMMHGVVEQGADDSHVVEERLFAEVDGWTISGAIDLQTLTMDGIEISDYKFTSVWATTEPKLEWERQLNVYRWLVETVKKTPVSRLSITAIIRDWNRHEAASGKGYPPAPVQVIEIPMWPMDQATTYVRLRVKAHQQAELYLPLCSDEDKWKRDTVYAVKKPGGKRALLLTPDKAVAEAEAIMRGAIVEIREGEAIRCENYCPVREWCEQRKQEVAAKVVSKLKENE